MQEKRHTMKSVTKPEWALLAAILIYSFVPTVGGLVRVAELSGGPSIVPANPRALAEPLPIVMHILSSVLFCVFGALQFLPSLRHQNPVIHRQIGRLVAAAGILSALTGLWMTLSFEFPRELQGPLLYWARVVLSLSMIGLIVWGIVAIKSRNVMSHRAAMLRAYAIGQGASTQAVLGIAWMILIGTEPLGDLRDVMMVSAWMLNLVAAEVLINRMCATRKRNLHILGKRFDRDVEKAARP